MQAGQVPPTLRVQVIEGGRARTVRAQIVQPAAGAASTRTESQSPRQAAPVRVHTRGQAPLAPGYGADGRARTQGPVGGRGRHLDQVL